jgi:virginiamycin B lyase
MHLRHARYLRRLRITGAGAPSGAAASKARAPVLLWMLVGIVALARCGTSTRAFKGTISVFALASPLEVAYDIAGGPDGDLWFRAGTDTLKHPNEADVEVIARMSVAGKVDSVFSLPAQHGARDLVRGPDGNIWCWEASGGLGEETITIDRITPKGDFTRFGVPSEHQYMFLTVGPDRNLWVTLEGAATIERMATDGKVLGTFAMPDHRMPREITVGPDGNLWLLDSDDFAVWRLTPDGTFTKFEAPSNGATTSGLRSITAGPDGNLWFAQGGTATTITATTSSG